MTNEGYYRTSGYFEFPRTLHPKTIGCSARHGALPDEMTANFTTIPPGVNQPLNCITGTSSNHTGAGAPEANFMTLKVMGLRILFFKSVAFNVLLTARAWVF